MNYDYGMTNETRNILTTLIGRNLRSYLATDEEKRHNSYTTFALRFAEEDIEFTTREIVQVADWFDELNTAEVLQHPNRDIQWPTGKWMNVRQADGTVSKVNRPSFYEIPLDRTITAISVAITTLTRDASKSKFGGESGSVDYIRALVFQFGDDALVFDKGTMFWGEMWDIKRCKAREISFFVEGTSKDYPEYISSVRLEHLPGTDK